MPLHMGEDMPSMGLPHLLSGHRAVGGGEPVRELPQTGQQPPLRAAAQGHLPLKEEEKDLPLLHPPGLSGGLDRQPVGQFPPAGQAQRPGRTDRAAGGAVGQTDGGPQLHQGLVELAGGLHREDILELSGDFFLHGGGGDVGKIPGDAGGYPQHVAVHRRIGQAEGDGGDGPGGVCPHAGQVQQGLVVGGQLAAVPLHEDVGRLLQAAGPAVIAQTLPQLQQPLLRQGGQLGYRGAGLQKSLVIAQHRLHPGLLQHDLGQPDVVGGRLPPPGQVPGVFRIPAQQGDGQLGEGLIHCLYPQTSDLHA